MDIGGLHLNPLDIILGVILIVAVFRSIWTGFSRSVAGLAGVIAGFWVGAHYFPALSYRLAPWIDSEIPRVLIAFFLIFLLVYLVFMIAGILVNGLFKIMKLSWFDRMLGGVVGLFKGLVFAGIIMFLLTIILPTNTPLLKESYLYPRLSRVIRSLVILVPEDVKGRFMWKWRHIQKPGKQISRKAV